MYQKNWKTPFVYVGLPLPSSHDLDYNVIPRMVCIIRGRLCLQSGPSILPFLLARVKKFLFEEKIRIGVRRTQHHVKQSIFLFSFSRCPCGIHGRPQNTKKGRFAVRNW